MTNKNSDKNKKSLKKRVIENFFSLSSLPDFNDPKAIFHCLVTCVALYIAMRCGGPGIPFGQLCIAFCCPYCYLLFAFVKKQNVLTGVCRPKGYFPSYPYQGMRS